MTEEWTDERRKAFGEKMATARAAKKTAESVEGVSDVKGEVKEFAGPQDVPAGVRPIAPKPVAGGREIDPGAIAGLQQAPDTGFAGSAGAFEVSGDVLGGNRAPKAVPGVATQKKAPGILFSDKKDDGGLPSQLKRSQGRSGPAEPTGLPCSCISFVRRKDPNTGEIVQVQEGMPTKLRGQDPSITWCAICGGERDGVARPENALKGKAAMQAVLQAGVQVDVESVAQRAASLIDYDLLASMVAAKMKGE